MEPKKQQTTSSSSSSFTNDLFGSTESSSASSSSGLFNSIFPPPSQDHIRNYIASQEAKKNYDMANRRDSSVDKEDKSRNPKTDTSTFYPQEYSSQPCHLSSSIYYGGQDIYTNPNVTKTTPGHSTYTKDGEDDGRASRGNWWQGSLYY